jgi:hypothetical protein
MLKGGGLNEERLLKAARCPIHPKPRRFNEIAKRCRGPVFCGGRCGILAQIVLGAS